MVWLGIVLVLATLSLVPLIVRAAHRRRQIDLEERQRFRAARNAAMTDLAALTATDDDATVDESRRLLHEATDGEAVRRVLVALRQRRLDLDPPCAIDPGHGAGSSTRLWSEGAEIPVCASCGDPASEVPRPKLVRRGDRHVPWFGGGPTYDDYAHGWFGSELDVFRLEAARLMEWDVPRERDELEGHPTMGAGWFGVLLAANHRMGKYSSG